MDRNHKIIKINAQVKIKILCLVLMVVSTILIAFFYSYDTNIKIYFKTTGKYLEKNRQITVVAPPNSKIFYDNKVFLTKAVVNIPDTSIINKKYRNNSLYIENTVHFKIKTLFKTKTINYSYRIYKVKIPVKLDISDSYNESYKTNLNKVNSIKTYADSIEFFGKTLPNCKITITPGNKNIESDSMGNFYISKNLKQAAGDLSITLLLKNYKPTQINYYIEKIVRVTRLKVYSDGATYYEPKALIYGLTNSGAKISVSGATILSIPKVDQKGYFSFYVYLDKGTNTFNITSFKENYEPNTKTINVMYIDSSKA